MSSTPECVTKHLKLKLAKNLPLFFLGCRAAITLRWTLNWGRPFDVANIPNIEAVYLCNQTLGSYGKVLIALIKIRLKLCRQLVYFHFNTYVMNTKPRRVGRLSFWKSNEVWFLLDKDAVFYWNSVKDRLLKKFTERANPIESGKLVQQFLARSQHMLRDENFLI